MDLGENFYVDPLPAPRSVTEIINADGDKAVEEILNQDITFRLFRSGNDDLVDFFCNHVDELLNLAFMSEEFELSAKAFAILDHSNGFLTLAMLTGGHLNTAAQRVLSQSNPKTMYLSRLSSLTFDAFMIAPDEAKEHCGYIFQMLYYLSEPSILSLFETTCCHDSDPSVQEWLLSLEFDKILLKEVESITMPKDTSMMSPEVYQICGLYNVLSYCATSPVMRKRFCTIPYIEAMYKFIGEMPDFIEDCRWNAISAIYCKETSEIMRGMFNAAITLIGTPRAASPAGVSVIKLLTHMIQSDEIARPFMTAADVIKIVVDLVMKYPYHSILQSAAREFLGAAMFQQRTRLVAVQDIVPAVLTAIKGATDRSSIASLYEIMHAAINIGKTDPKAFAVMKDHEGFLDFLKNEYVEHNCLLNRAYGGAVPGVCNDIKYLVGQACRRGM